MANTLFTISADDIVIMAESLKTFAYIAANIYGEGLIQNNTAPTEIERKCNMIEISPNEPGCIYCKMLLGQICSILKKIEAFHKKEMNIICEHCKGINSTSRCKRCTYFVRKIKEEDENFKDIELYKEILNDIKFFLEALVRDKHITSKKTFSNSVEELKKMLESLKTSSINQMAVKQLANIEIEKYKIDWENIDKIEKSNVQGKQVSLSIERSNSDELKPKKREICICKELARKLGKNLCLSSGLTNKSSKLNVSLNKTFTLKDTENENVANITKSKTDYMESRLQTPKGIKAFEKSIKVSGEKKEKGKKPFKIESGQKSELFMKMIIRHQEKRKRRDTKYNLKRVAMAQLDNLPPLPTKESKEPLPEDSTSILECDHLQLSESIEEINGNKITARVQDKTQLSGHSRFPLRSLFYEVRYDFSDATTNLSDNNLEDRSSRVLEQGRNSFELPINNSFTKFQLSNKKYIEDGWTVLPTVKILRRMNVYKMAPSHPEFDWFDKYKGRKYMQYDTGEKLCEIGDDGQVRWYYRDGSIALYIYNSREISTEKCLIYDSFELKKGKELRKGDSILACFDTRGHAIVYNRQGSIRLKYNQCEGVLLDKKVGPWAHWKWHALNDPPVLQQVIEEKSLGLTVDCLRDLIQTSEQNNIIESSKIFDKDMYTIELNNSVKEKSKKAPINYKPFEIRFKVLKLNEHFTLRIINQSKIYIQFRDGAVSFKLNLGMKLISNEIIGIETVDLAEVGTPYDNKAWKTDESFNWNTENEINSPSIRKLNNMQKPVEEITKKKNKRRF